MRNIEDALSRVRKIIRMGYQFVRIHPNGSGTAAFFLALYLVCPLGFMFLTYSIAISYGAAVMIKVIANCETYDAWEDNDSNPVSKDREFPPIKSGSAEGDSNCGKFKKPVISPQMSKRRNFKIRIGDLETPDDAERKQGEENVVDGVWKDLDHDHRVDDEKLEYEDGGMVIDEGIFVQRGGSIPEPEELHQSREGSRSQSEVDDGSKYGEDAREDRNRAVEWTENDEKNLTDLGLSEIERNKRLENLIAKRWSKRAMSISHHGSISPVNTSKNHFMPTHLSSGSPESHLPGSAPSVLLPQRNPFDLPYDSNEEKPNLTVDSFGAEILAPHPKDILSRHESFFYGHSSTPEIDEDSGRISHLEKGNVREPRNSRCRQKSGRRDFLVEQKLYREEHPKTRPDVLENRGLPDEQVMEQHQDDTSVTESVSSSFEDQKEDPQTSKDQNFSFQATSPHRINVSPCEHGHRVAEHINGTSNHTSTVSIASDMQVEISGSSTPTTVAGFNISPDDAESSRHEGDMVRKTGFTNDEIWGALSKHDDIVTLELPEDGEDEETSKQNDNSSNGSVNYPFGSYISLIELDRQEFQQRQQLRHAAIHDHCSGSDLQVRNARSDDSLN